MLIIRRLNSIDVASGIVTFSQWPSGAQVGKEVIETVKRSNTTDLCSWYPINVEMRQSEIFSDYPPTNEVVISTFKTCILCLWFRAL
jgi:hypothetical protein